MSVTYIADVHSVRKFSWLFLDTWNLVKKGNHGNRLRINPRRGRIECGAIRPECRSWHAIWTNSKTNHLIIGHDAKKEHNPSNHAYCSKSIEGGEVRVWSDEQPDLNAHTCEFLSSFLLLKVGFAFLLQYVLPVTFVRNPVYANQFSFLPKSKCKKLQNQKIRRYRNLGVHCLHMNGWKVGEESVFRAS